MEDERERTEEDRITPAYGPGETSLIRTVPSLARIAMAAYWRGARWTVRASARAGSQVMRAAVTGQDPAELFRSTGADMRSRARRMLGIADRPPDEPAPVTPEGIAAEREEARQSLRDRGAELLRRSADVNFDEDSHPAYTRILEDLAPDEARILRLIAEGGPQPAVDVRSGLAFVPGSRLIAQGFSMIGAEAGCRFVDQVPAYLSNLNRLGLVWFSREPVTDNERYQVLEVQPDVLEALDDAGRFSHVVRRSIGMTPLGRDFCGVALPLETAEIDAIGGATGGRG